MCDKQSRDINALFTRDADAHRLWEASFPDPRTVDHAVNETLEKIHELAQQKDRASAD